MAIILEAAYSKKLGLPSYSSHSYVVSIRTELSDLTQVEAESARLYALLQRSVDGQIQEVGFLPDATTYGMDGHHANAHQNRGDANNANGNGDEDRRRDRPLEPDRPVDVWVCSDKQKELILKLVEQHKLDKQEVEALAKEMFGLPVKTLNRLQASGLIEELLERHGKRTNGSGKAKSNGGFQRRHHPSHGLPTLVGVLDLVQNETVIDFKTSSTTPNPERAALVNATQATAYAMLYRENTGRKEVGIELHHLVKLKQPKLVVVTLPSIGEREQSRLLRVIDSYVEGLDRRDFIPSPGLQCASCEFFS